MTLIDFTIRIAASILFGFLIGFERQLTGHFAGIHTNVLVSLGSCLFVLFSLIMSAPDQTRIAAQIVTGVGFLCSGIIFKDGVNVRGLNTAATIWCTASIGVLTSSGFILYSALATGLLIAVNLLLHAFSNKINPILQFMENGRYYQVLVVCAKDHEMLIRSLIMDYISANKLALIELGSSDTAENTVKIDAKINGNGKRQDEIIENLIDKISHDQQAISVGWELI